MPPHGDEDAGSSRERFDSGEEGTLSPEELETENTERAYVFRIEVKDEAELQIQTDGGVDVPFGLSYTEIKDIINRLIVLCGLIVLALLLWRIGIVNRVLDFASVS